MYVDFFLTDMVFLSSEDFVPLRSDIIHANAARAVSAED
jgi:hypothetical protein